MGHAEFQTDGILFYIATEIACPLATCMSGCRVFPTILATPPIKT